MTDGTCVLCGDSYTKRGMTRHLRSCLAEQYNLDIADVYEALAYYHNNPRLRFRNAASTQIRSQ